LCARDLGVNRVGIYRRDADKGGAGVNGSLPVRLRDVSAIPNVIIDGAKRTTPDTALFCIERDCTGICQ